MKKKLAGPDLKKWKEFRYNLIKEDTIGDYEVYDDSAEQESIDASKKQFIEKIFPQIDKWAETIENMRDSSDDTSSYSYLIDFIDKLYAVLRKYGMTEMPQYEIPENIEIDADNEEDAQNWMNEPDEPHTYQLKNGKTLEIEEKDAPGMAGEPSTFILLSVDGKSVRFEQIKHLMQPEDAQELEQWIEETNAQNDASARSWVREGKKPTKYFDVAKWRESHKK